jgi:hypothetical protein
MYGGLIWTLNIYFRRQHFQNSEKRLAENKCLFLIVKVKGDSNTLKEMI